LRAQCFKIAAKPLSISCTMLLFIRPALLLIAVTLFIGPPVGGYGLSPLGCKLHAPVIPFRQSIRRLSVAAKQRTRINFSDYNIEGECHIIYMFLAI
jgi:hypothetical protein